MRRVHLLAFALLASTGLAGAAQANTCQAGKLMCATAMPVGGYCECTARGTTESGEVVAQAMSRRPANARAGGCGAQPNAPGCH